MADAPGTQGGFCVPQLLGRVSVQGPRSSHDAGRTIRQIAQDLGISKQTIYVWRRQHFIEPDGCPDRPEAIKQNSWPHGDGSPHWRAEVAIHHRAAELTGRVVPPKDGSRPSR
ncbi:hypothetical protein E4K10_46720 [Streptomyces sp. T1317-0309]|nr:hypothetical protein E4K10_46720 [Streptomyces sp. T1317-0309]